MFALQISLLALGVLIFSSFAWADESAPVLPELPAEKPPIVVELEAATQDLQIPSETDAPFRAFFWRVETEEEFAEEMTPEHAANLAELEAATPVEERDLEELLGELGIEEEWMDEEAKATARRFADLKEFLEANLCDLKIYLFGERKKDVIIVGKVENGFAGLITLVVET